jgi:hypothetical protein
MPPPITFGADAGQVAVAFSSSPATKLALVAPDRSDSSSSSWRGTFATGRSTRSEECCRWVRGIEAAMATSGREESSGHLHLHDVDEGCARPDPDTTIDRSATHGPPEVRSAASQARGVVAGRAAFRVAVTVVILAPLALIVSSLAALSAGFCQDGKPAEDCPSIDSIASLLRLVLLAMGVLFLGSVAALIASVRRAHGARIASTHSESDGVVRTNRKGIAAGGFAAIATTASLLAVLGDAEDPGVLGVLLAIPAALLAVVFGLRALAEAHHSSSRESGTTTAEVGVAFGAVVSVGWIIAAVATF